MLLLRIRRRREYAPVGVGAGHGGLHQRRVGDGSSDLGRGAVVSPRRSREWLPALWRLRRRGRSAAPAIPLPIRCPPQEASRSWRFGSSTTPDAPLAIRTRVSLWKCLHPPTAAITALVGSRQHAAKNRWRKARVGEDNPSVVAMRGWIMPEPLVMPASALCLDAARLRHKPP